MSKKQHKICLTWTGGREVLSLAPDATVQDVAQVAQRHLKCPLEHLVLTTGWERQPLRLSSADVVVARSVLPHLTRVQCDVVAPTEENKTESNTAVSAPTKKRHWSEDKDENDSGRHQAERNNKWECSACTFLNGSDRPSCEICETARGGSQQKVARRDDSPVPPTLPAEITIVSLNVSNLDPSFSAPAGWDPLPAFRQEILRHNPDIVCLQEVPPDDITGFLPGYSSVGRKESHCNFVTLLVKNEWAPFVTQIEIVPPSTPVVWAQMTFAQGRDVLFGSCHLAPFGPNASVRLDQLRRALSAVSGGARPVVVAGDFNMRQAEDKDVEQLGLRDAWKETGSVSQHKFTWDSRKTNGPYNRYHDPHQPPAYGFHCRFDRIYYFQTPDNNIAPANFSLMANEPITNEYHYLSDHFGMVANFKTGGTTG